MKQEDMRHFIQANENSLYNLFNVSTIKKGFIDCLMYLTLNKKIFRKLFNVSLT